MNTYQTILTDQADRIFFITFNQGDRLNPISAVVMRELEQALESVRLDDSVHVVVIKANGRAFSAGYDLNKEAWITSQYPGDADGQVDLQRDRRDVHEIVDYWLRMWRYPKPIISQVQGDCLSGAGELLAVTDLAIVSERARFGHPAACDLGIPPSIMFWPILIGLRKTKELLYTSKLIDAHEAMRIGLVNEVVPHDELAEHVLKVATKIAKAPSDNLAILKEVANTWFENMGIQESIRTGADLDAIYHQNPSYIDFFQTLQKDGAKAAFAKRKKLYGEAETDD